MHNSSKQVNAREQNVKEIKAEHFSRLQRRHARCLLCDPGYNLLGEGARQSSAQKIRVVDGMAKKKKTASSQIASMNVDLKSLHFLVYLFV